MSRIVVTAALAAALLIAGAARAGDTEGRSSGPSHTVAPNTGAGNAAPGPFDPPVDRAVIVTKSPTLTPVPENRPVALDLSLVEVSGIEPSLTRGVTAKAYTRYVRIEGRRIAQVVLTALEKNGREEGLDARTFTAQFDLETPALDPAVPIRLEGSRAQIRAALERLAEQPSVAGNDDEDEDANERDGERAAKGRAGTNRGENRDAAAYENPAALPETENAVPVVRVTTEGCTLRVDLAQGHAVQQSRVEITENGVVDPGTCEDSGQRFPLQRSYNACGDLVDLEARNATAQYVLFYTDGGGGRTEVAECTADPEQVFAIVEDRAGCTVYLDYRAMQAVPRAALVYRNASNADVQVRGCEASQELEAVDLVETTDGCSLRHDFGAGLSYHQSRHVYTLGGVTWQAGFCADSETRYPHESVYETDTGEAVCAPVIDKDGGMVTRRYRTAIVMDAVKTFITECTPDTSSSAMVATTDGCDNPAAWTHDVAAGVSYARERFYYMFSGERVYVTECQPGSTTYTHDVAITGWENHDDRLYAYPLKTVSISPPFGYHVILSNQVLSGEAQQPYAYEGVATLASGDVTYEGCSRFEGRNVVERHTRPDGSVYAPVTGAAEPLGPIEACISEITDFVRVETERNSFRDEAYCGMVNGVAQYRDAGLSGTYRATRLITREDGATIGNTPEVARKSLRCAYYCGGYEEAHEYYFRNVDAKHCPASVSHALQAQWYSELGWD